MTAFSGWFSVGWASLKLQHIKFLLVILIRILKSFPNIYFEIQLLLELGS